MYIDVRLICLNFYTCIRLHYLAEVLSSLLSVYHFERKVSYKCFRITSDWTGWTCWTVYCTDSNARQIKYFHNSSQEPKDYIKQANKKSITVISIIITHHLWCCGGCRLMTANVSMLLQHFNTFADSVSKQISQLSTNKNNRLQQLDDRITAHVNQNKCILADITSSQSDIKSSLANIKTDLDKKTNNLITKTQSKVDRIKAAPDLAPKKSQGKPGSVGIQNKQVMPSNKKSSNTAENRSKLSKNAKSDKPFTPPSPPPSAPQTKKSVNPPNSIMSGNRVATASSGNLQQQLREICQNRNVAEVPT